MPTPASSIRFQGNSYIQPRKAGSPNPDGMGLTFQNSQKVTMAFWLQVNALPTDGFMTPVALHRYGGLWPRINTDGTIAVAGGYNVVPDTSLKSFITTTMPVVLGSANHFVIVFDGSSNGPATIDVYRNGDPAAHLNMLNGPCVLALAAGYSHLNLGNFAQDIRNFRSADIQLADVAIWNGYVGTAQDATDFTNGSKRPSDVAAGQLAFYMTGDGGTVGNAVLAGDPGVANQGNDANFNSLEGFTYDFRAMSGTTGNSVQGSLVYGGGFTYVPPVVALPYIPESGEGIGFLFKTSNGGKAHMAMTPTRATVVVANRHPTIAIHRAGGGTDNVTLDPAHTYFDNANVAGDDGVIGQDWLYYDLRAQGVAPIGPGDTVDVVCQRHWTAFQEGYCREFTGSASRTSPLLPVPAGRKSLRIGYNFPRPTGSTVPHYGNWFRWVDRCQGYNANGTANNAMPRDANGLYQPGAAAAGSYVTGILVNATDVLGYDLAASRGTRSFPVNNYDNVNVYYDNPTYGTAGFKLGYLNRIIPKRGKVHVVWDYVAGHDGDGVVRVCLGNDTGDAGPSLTGLMTIGNLVQSWTFNPAVQGGTGGTNYCRTYTYVANDPVNGLGPHGAILTPPLRVIWTGWVTNIRVTFEADADLPAAAWNVDKFNPPVWHPFLTDEVFKDVDTIRFIDYVAGYGSALSSINQFIPDGYYTWGLSYNANPQDQGWPGSVPIASITPYPEAEIANLRATYAGSFGGGMPAKITTAVPHNLKTGAFTQINWGSSVTMTGTKLGGGAYNVNMGRATGWRPARVLSPTELFVWLYFDVTGNTEPYGTLDRVYSGADLTGAVVVTYRMRTMPLHAIGGLCNQVRTHAHFNLAYALALDTGEATAVADAIASTFPADRNFYLEVGNEMWNFAGTFSAPLQIAGDEAGLVNGVSPGWPQAFAQHVNITARVAKLFRQRWALAGLDPSRVKTLINDGAGWLLPYAIPSIQACNTSGDPLLRIDEVSCNNYWSNLGGTSGGEGNPVEFVGREDLTANQTLDLLELRVSRGGGCFATNRYHRDTLNAAGLADVQLSSYEAGVEVLTVGMQKSPVYSAADPSTQVAAAKLALLQTTIFRSPRWANIRTQTYLRMQNAGISRINQFTHSLQPWFDITADANASVRMQSRSWWTSYLSLEQSGKGDGSDGLWDNRPTAGRPYAPHSLGDAVSVDAYALKAWNRMSDAPGGENQPPTITVPALEMSVTVHQPIRFQATASDPDSNQALTFSLDAGSPPGATIDPSTGSFTWLADKPGKYNVTVRVTDDGPGPLSAACQVTIVAATQIEITSRRHGPVV